MGSSFKSGWLSLAALSVTFATQWDASAGTPQDAKGVNQPPVEFSNIVITRGEFGGAVNFTMTNLSSKRVCAYILEVDTSDSSGKSLGGPTQSAEMMPPPGGKGDYSPGEQWKENVTLGQQYQDGTPLIAASAQISLDYVLFDDGTGWGPNKSRQAIALGKMRRGVLQERDRLRKLLAERGVKALLDDLSQEVAAK